MKNGTIRKSHKKGFPIFLLVIALAIAAIASYDTITDPMCYWNFHGIYVSDAGYAKAFGIRKLEYDAFVSQYGNPLETTIRFDGQGKENGFTAQYPGILLECVYWEQAQNPEDQTIPHLILTTVTDARYRFGWQKIGVGSTKGQVHFAYLLDKRFSQEKIQANGYQADEAYCADGWRWILFDYDANGRVERMRITHATI